MSGAPAGTLEREVKLEAGDDFRLPDLGGSPLEARSFSSTYFDTPERRLLELGITLRRRVEKGRSLWQLKLPRRNGRLELEVAGGPKPPSDLLDLLVAVLGDRDVAPLVRLQTRRSGVLVSDGERPVAEVTVDDVTVFEGRRRAGRFRELEIELVEGDEREAARLARQLRRAGARRGDGRVKLERALALAPPADPAPQAAEPEGAALVREVIGSQLRTILVHDPAMRAGDDAEDVHRLRVAVRRLRAFLRAARPLLLPDAGEPLRSELSWLGSALGGLRDLDVMIETLGAQGDDLPEADAEHLQRVLAELAAERAQAREDALGVLRGERYLALIAALRATAEAPPVAAAPEMSVSDVAAAEHARLRRSMRRLGGRPSDRRLHKTRIRAKRARYAAELAAGEAGGGARRVARRAKRLQDVIGLHQDAVVAEERLRELAGRLSGGPASFVAGRLAELQRGRRRRARAALPKALRKMKRAGRRAWR